MNLKFYSINKPIIFVFAIVLFVISSCISSRYANVSDFIKPVSYNKVRVEVSSGFLDGGMRGYIYIIPDSQVCFRFWGPLGYEIGKGYISKSKLLFYNEIDDILISDLQSRIENMSGCSINLEVFQTLLMGNIEGFITSVNQLNKGLLDINIDKRSKRSVITLQHRLNHSQMVVYFFYRKGNLTDIQLIFKQDKSYTKASFELLDTSYDRKKCTFAF